MKKDGCTQPENIDQGSKKTENKCYASKEEVAAEFENAYKNVKNFHKRFLFFALKHIRRCFHSNSFRNIDAEDVVQIVIKSILTLRRKWYKNQITDFQKFFRLSILSYIRNEWKRENIVETVEMFDEEGDLSQENIKEIIREYACEEAASKCFNKGIEDIITECSSKLADDVYASFVFEEICEGLRSNIEIAAKLKIKVCDVEKAKKRIRRKLKELKSIKDMRDPKQE